MDLLVKRYLNKTSKIGIKFLYEHQAIREYEALVAQLGDSRASLKLEFMKNKINLFLVSQHSGKKIGYSGLDYKTEQIQLLQKEDSADLEFQFVHVFAKKNALVVAKPFYKEIFLTISGIEILNLP